MNANIKHYSNTIWLCILVEWLCFFAFPLKAQMKLGTSGSPAHANAILELEVDDLGLLFPRVSTATRLGTLAAAPAGLVVYDRDLNQLMIKVSALSSGWVSLAAHQGANNLLADTTKFKVGIFNGGTQIGNQNSPPLVVTGSNNYINWQNRGSERRRFLASFTKSMDPRGDEVSFFLGQDTLSDGVFFKYIRNDFDYKKSGFFLNFPGKGDVMGITKDGGFYLTVPQQNDSGILGETDNRITHAGFYHINSYESLFPGKKYGHTLRIGEGPAYTPSQNFYVGNHAQTAFFTMRDPDVAEYDFDAPYYYVVEHKLFRQLYQYDIINGQLVNSNMNWYMQYTSKKKLFLGNGGSARYLNQEIRTISLDASSKEVPNRGLVSMGHQSPDASAVLDLNYQGPSNDLGRGLLLPRYSSAVLNDVKFYQPAKGLLAFDQTQNRVVMNAGTPQVRDWRPLLTGASNASEIYTGTANLVSGSAIRVNNAKVKANSVIILTCQNGGGGTASPSVSNKAEGGFTINASGDGVSRTIAYLIIN